MTHLCGEVLDAKETARCCKEFEYEVQTVIYKKEGEDAIRYGLVIEKDVRYIRQCCFRRRNRPSEFRVTIHIYHDILVFLEGFGSGPEL